MSFVEYGRSWRGDGRGKSDIDAMLMYDVLRTKITI